MRRSRCLPAAAHKDLAFREAGRSKRSRQTLGQIGPGSTMRTCPVWYPGGRVRPTRSLRSHALCDGTGDNGAWPHLERWLFENEVNGTITLAHEFDSAHEVHATDLPSLAQPALERLWLAAGTLATGKVRKATEAAAILPVECVN